MLHKGETEQDSRKAPFLFALTTVIYLVCLRLGWTFLTRSSFALKPHHESCFSICNKTLFLSEKGTSRTKWYQIHALTNFSQHDLYLKRKWWTTGNFTPLFCSAWWIKVKRSTNSAIRKGRICSRRTNHQAAPRSRSKHGTNETKSGVDETNRHARVEQESWQLVISRVSVIRQRCRCGE